MIIEVKINGQDYKLSDEGEFDDPEEEYVFEIEGKYVFGMFDDLLGAPIDNVWQIIEQDDLRKRNLYKRRGRGDSKIPERKLLCPDLQQNSR